MYILVMRIPVEPKMAESCHQCEGAPDFFVEYATGFSGGVKPTCRKCLEKIGPEVLEFMIRARTIKIIE